MIRLRGIEEQILRAQMVALNNAMDAFNKSATMVLAREGIALATVESLRDGKLIVTLPSD